MSKATVKLWGTAIGYVAMEPGEAFARFEYDPEFARMGIELAPLQMPVKARRIYQFPQLHPRTFHGLPGLLADSLPHTYGNQLTNVWPAQPGRRESEFNHVVGSPVGALGLMQLMPGTAREVAGELGVAYSRPRLTSDWAYNALLGTRYLANLTETFGQSPVLIAAGYNAGPSRPWRWMQERGDPRRGEVDPVDWIEHIPFDETRNYVMRVTESIPVYRARLTGETGPVGFRALLVGQPPFVRPQARAIPEVIEAEDGGLVALPETPPPARPLARPGG